MLNNNQKLFIYDSMNTDLREINSDTFLLKLKNNLVYLHMSNFDESMIPTSLCNIKTINEIHLKSYLFGLEEILHLFPPTLKKLTISDSLLLTISNSIDQLTNLEELTIHHCYTKYLPKAIGNLRNLRKLTISQTPIVKIHKLIFSFPNLEVLNLEHTKIPHIQKIKRRMPYLRYFNNIVLHLLNHFHIRNARNS